jgi:transcription elongation GreA/GreB family factor
MISAIMKRKLDRRLQSLEEQREEAKQAVSVAASFGDKRENSSYEMAVETLATIERDISEVRSRLHSEVVSPIPGLFSIGSLVEVSSVEIAQEFKVQLLLETEGDCVFDGILSASSPVGRAILHKKPGIFEVLVKGKILKYAVSLSEDEEKYFTTFASDSSQRLLALLGGEYSVFAN